jgi:hypothetical protein
LVLPKSSWLVENPGSELAGCDARTWAACKLQTAGACYLLF